ncbi:MAG: protein kinase [Planctomycetes bacterium]|nr:protein kinase [Planctomycetota bacterium]
MKPTEDPDETPTRFRGQTPSDARADADEGRTVPSMSQAGKAAPSSPSPPPPPGGPKGHDPLLGKELGGCRIESLLGRGAMGAVYRARQIRLDRDVAVKVIRPEMMTDERMLKRFEVEARTVGRFNSQHVVMVHDVGFDLGVHYLVMEFVQGKNLREHTKLLAGGRLPAAEAIPLLRQACKGLEEAQRLGVIHRDVKPDNLMLTDRGVLKIADFGIAKPLQDDFSLTMSAELIGTPLYMSPEQCQGIADLDFRSDMYSLGATFYYLLTGEPPVRASSVYELIQTKTKLEHLCLWKALPELDENHPLSRIVERMTALDREDRYPSYEALLHDIAQVEQGRELARVEGTAKSPAKGGKPAGARTSARGSGLLAVGLVVALAAAGGYWWSTRGDAAGNATGGPGAADPAAAQARLQELRATFARQGPSQALRRELVALPLEAPGQGERDRLVADVDQGLAMQERLAKAPPPTALELPFDDLRQHFAAVDAATAMRGAAGEELQAWAGTARTAARAERVLGSDAKAKLLGAFAQWQNERGRAGDEAKRVELGERLEAIERGRRQLLELLPALAPEVDRTLSQKVIDDARLGLRTKAVPVEEVDVDEALQAIAREFERDGPNDSLVERTRKLAPSQLGQVKERDRLLDAFQHAADRRRDAERANTDRRPQEPRLPFDDVAGFYAQLDRALDPLQAEGGLPPWAAALRTRLRDETALQAKVLATCRGAFADWQRESQSDDAVVAELEASWASLTSGIERAAELFPAAKPELDRLLPADALANARTRLERAQQRREVLAAGPLLLRRLDRVRSIADWRSVREPWLADLAAAQAKAQAFAGDAAVEGDLRSAVQLRDRWVQASQRVDEFAAKFAAGDLAGARSTADASVVGSEGRDELRVLGAVVGKCLDGLRQFDADLDVGRAVAALDDAAGLLRDHTGLAPDVVGRLGAWSERLRDLQRAAQDMVPIAAGNTRFGPAPAFFLGRTEVSQGDYQRFLDQVHALVEAVPAELRAAEIVKRIGGPSDWVLPPDQVQRLLGRRGRLQAPELPVDNVTWYEAATYARWHGLSLPTKAEWALAAFGPDRAMAWPWGPEWKLDDACRNIGSKLVPVTSGGRSWRSTAAAPVHHLAGNVAEWLQAEPGASIGHLAGGRCQDPLAEARRRAAGDDFHEASLGKALDGFGFRVVLRPRDFLGGDFPAARR